MADIQRQGSAKPQTWQDGAAVSNALAVGDGTRAEALAALAYGWDVGTSSWIKVAAKPASAIAAATDLALVVQHSPQRADASLLAQTATGTAGAAVTLTLASGGAGLFHYITYIQIAKFATALLTAAATPVLVTTTNLSNTPAFSFSAAASAQGTNEVQ